MNVVDSSGWLEYLADGSNADFFASAIEDTARLIVPSISVYEVFKCVLQQRGEGDALRAVALMMQGQVVPLAAGLRPAHGGVDHRRQRRGGDDGRKRRPQPDVGYRGRVDDGALPGGQLQTVGQAGGAGVGAGNVGQCAQRDRHLGIGGHTT